MAVIAAKLSRFRFMRLYRLDNVQSDSNGSLSQEISRLAIMEHSFDWDLSQDINFSDQGTFGDMR